MNIDKILSRLEKVRKKTSDSWVACCPVHNEKTPSMVVTLKPDKIIAHCFGCDAKAPQIMAALGLDWDDFFLEPLKERKGDGKNNNKFPALAVLNALVFEAQVLALAAEDIKHGVMLTDENYKRMIVCCNRIIEARQYVG